MLLCCNMYFIEFIIKKFTQKKEVSSYIPTLENENSDYEGCEHIFMPIDSTNEILSCTKCGFLASRKELKNKNLKKNFFIKEK